MFDVDLSKLTVIVVVAMVVLGPERLPQVARTAGTLIGRAQRYINGVRHDLAQQVELDELRQLKDSLHAAHRSVEHGVREAVHGVREHATSIGSGVSQTLAGVGASLADSPTFGPAPPPADLDTPRASWSETVAQAASRTPERLEPSTSGRPTFPERSRSPVGRRLGRPVTSLPPRRRLGTSAARQARGARG